MKRLRQARRSYSGLIIVGAILFQLTLLHAQAPSAALRLRSGQGSGSPVGLRPEGQAIPIAVVEFEGNGISQTEAIALTDRLRNELFRLGAFEVVERGMMETILTEQDFQMTGCTSNDCLVEVGQLLGARQVVGGRISRVGAMFTVSARVVDVQTGKLLGVSDFDLRGGLEEMLTDGMKQVALMLSGGEVATTAIKSRPDIRESNQKTSIGVGDQRPRTWSISVGLGASRSPNLIGISRDFLIGTKLSISLNAGLGVQIIGGGITFWRDYNAKGLLLSMSLGAGVEPSTGGETWTITGVVAYQWPLGRQGFVVMGGAITGTTLFSPMRGGMYPVVSYDYRF